MPHPTRATMNQHGLSLVDLRVIDERLPRCRCGQRHGCGFFKINVFRLKRHLALLRGRELRITTTAHDWQISVNRIASFELRYPGSGFFDNTSDIIPDDYWLFHPSYAPTAFPAARTYRQDSPRP